MTKRSAIKPVNNFCTMDFKEDKEIFHILKYLWDKL